MKVKNIAFSGFAAAILATGAANAAPQIASKAYVDGIQTSTLNTVADTYITKTDVQNTYVTNAGLSDKITEELGKETSDLKDAVATQVTNNITQVLNNENSDLAKALAGKASASDVEALQTTVSGDDGNGGLVADVNALKTTVGNTTSGLVKDVDDLDARVTKNETDIKALNDGLNDTVNDAIAGALTGEGEIKDAIDKAINKAVGDLPVGELTNNVNSLKAAVGDADSGLTKQANDNTAAIETLNGDATTEGSVANTVSTMAIPKPQPGDCDADSSLCVLTVKKDGTLGWVDVTAPVE